MESEGVYAYLTVQAAVGSYGAVVILNTATDTPIVLTTYPMPCAQPNGIIVSGSYAYVTCYDSGVLYVLSIDNTNPSAPVLGIVGSVGGLQDPFPGISLSGTHVFVPSHNAGMIYRVNIFSPAAPAIDGQIATAAGTAPDAVFVSGGYVYCACGAELPATSYFQVFTADGMMSNAGQIMVAHAPQRLVVRENYAYVTYFDAQAMDVIDIAAPTTPVIKATVPLACYALPIVLSGSYAYAGCYSSDGSIAKIDITVPTAPFLVSKTATSASPVQALDLSGSHLLVAAAAVGGRFAELNLAGDGLSVWIANGNNVAALNVDGSVYKPAISNGGMGLAIDGAGNVWSANASGSVAEFSSTGNVLSSGYSIGAGNTPAAIAVDGVGAVWTANSNGSVSALSNSGAILSPATGYTDSLFSNPAAISIDISGNVWVANAGNDSVSEIIGGAAPAPPIVTGVQNKTLGVRP
ncbi:MAG TPA: hypothetical protein VGB94_00540 [Acidobacteriaceae bacterium]